MTLLESLLAALESRHPRATVARACATSATPQAIGALRAQQQNETVRSGPPGDHRGSRESWDSPSPVSERQHNLAESFGCAGPRRIVELGLAVWDRGCPRSPRASHVHARSQSSAASHGAVARWRARADAVAAARDSGRRARLASVARDGHARRRTHEGRIAERAQLATSVRARVDEAAAGAVAHRRRSGDAGSVRRSARTS